jgi:hypothetical protein
VLPTRADWPLSALDRKDKDSPESRR